MPSILEFVGENQKAALIVHAIPVQVTYNPNRVTLGRMGEITRSANLGNVESLARLLSEVLVSWDIEGPLYTDPVDEDEEPEELVGAGDIVPITFENLVALPGTFVTDLGNQMMDRVMDGANPTKAKPRSRKR